MRKSLLLSIVVLGMMGATAAYAKHYGSAGCGLGSQIFKDNAQVSQVLAATTNGTSASQTFGISSGTSNCTDNGAVAANKEYPMFVEANQVALANDIARGGGETLSALSKVMGCADQAKLTGALRANYNGIFTKENVQGYKVGASILDVVKKDAALSKECKYRG